MSTTLLVLLFPVCGLGGVTGPDLATIGYAHAWRSALPKIRPLSHVLTLSMESNDESPLEPDDNGPHPRPHRSRWPLRDGFRRSLAQDVRRYVVAKPGVSFFNGDLDEEHPQGYFSEYGYGIPLRPGLAIEGTIGYFHDGVSEGGDVRGMPLMLSVKQRVCGMDRLEPFVGGGIGLYISEYEGRLKGVFVDDVDGVLGGHLLFGADYHLYRSFFVGIEGKYMITEKAKFHGVGVDLNGIAVVARIGLKLR